MNTSKHLLFLLSPFVVIGATVTFISVGYDRLADIMVIVLKGYSVVFFLVSSYFVFRYGKWDLESKWDRFVIRNGYPGGATIFFAWLFLLPMMKNVVGMWESQFLNMLVTLALGYFVFYFLIGVYHLISLLFQNEKIHS